MRKKRTKKSRRGAGSMRAVPPESSERAGMPAADSIREVVPFTSPANRSYRILKTDERDAYDAPPDPAKRGRRHPE